MFIQENALENIFWKMSAILSRPQCVKCMTMSRIIQYLTLDMGKTSRENMLVHNNVFSLYFWLRYETKSLWNIILASKAIVLIPLCFQRLKKSSKSNVHNTHMNSTYCVGYICVTAICGAILCDVIVETIVAVMTIIARHGFRWEFRFFICHMKYDDVSVAACSSCQDTYALFIKVLW